MRDLLHHAVVQGISGVYARGLLAAFNDGAPQPAVSAPAIVAGLAEPLTARETEILRLVAAGMRNQEIADQLVISLSTVKRHIANTYGKLGVTHRTEAVARLRAEPTTSLPKNYTPDLHPSAEGGTCTRW